MPSAWHGLATCCACGFSVSTREILGGPTSLEGSHLCLYFLGRLCLFFVSLVSFLLFGSNSLEREAPG